MARKKIIPILLFSSLVVVSGWSQQDSTQRAHWSLGVSTGDILHQLFNTDVSIKTYPAFMLEYAGRAYAVQAGFRPGYNQAHTTYEGFVDSEIDKQLSFSGQIAGTRIIFDEHHWQIKAGLLVSGGWSREDNIEDSGFDRVTTRRLEWNAGLGPVIDFRFFVDPRISLGMEASLVYSWSRSELQQLFSGFPEFDNTKETVTGEGLDVREPATIYFRFHF